MPRSPIVEPALPEEVVEALRLVFQHLPEPDRVARVGNTLTLICQNELDPRGVLVARRRSQLLGAVVCQPLAGAGGLVWPPQVRTGAADPDLAVSLVQSACAWLREQGARIAQAILRPEEITLAEPLLRNGFRHITGLWYMRRPVSDTSARDLRKLGGSSAKSVTFHDYTRCDREIFRQTLMRTYQGTLDCPELNGLRSAEEIIAGHRDQGKHDPQLWWLVREKSLPVGVLLLGHMPEWDALDISYLGVRPEARGHGLGRVLAARALQEAKSRRVHQVTLAVDRRNLPAWAMYRQLGFEPHEEREVYLRIEPP
jgi:ribosomal protein S18 acetylase RimI-like enzyme